MNARVLIRGIPDSGQRASGANTRLLVGDAGQSNGLARGSPSLQLVYNLAVRASLRTGVVEANESANGEREWPREVGAPGEESEADDGH